MIILKYKSILGFLKDEEAKTGLLSGYGYSQSKEKNNWRNMPTVSLPLWLYQQPFPSLLFSIQNTMSSPFQIKESVVYLKLQCGT